MSTDTAFSLLDPLPVRRLALEASAGTGKTYTLAGLATRLLAETDVTASDLLVVTFTRAATAELRARIRDRLVAAADHLAADVTPPTDDPILEHLATAAPESRQRAATRLARAVTDFDAATITTIHGFATQVLGSLGLAAGIDADAALVDDADELIADACADVLTAAATAGHAPGDLPRPKKLVEITTSLLAIPDLVLSPRADQAGATPADLLLRELAEAAAAAVAARRRREGTMSFDDVLTTLRSALDPARPGHDVVHAALRERYRVALVDEFQDTDPVQWDIFSTLFGAPDDAARLVLVGDPKQAIYAFRGANIHTYLTAIDTTPEADRRSLSTNWRSDGAVLEALEVLLAGTTFGSPAIAFHPVSAAEAHVDRRMCHTDGTPLPALSLRLALRADIDRTSTGHLDTRQAERAIYRDLVAGLRELFDGAEIPTRSDAGGPEGTMRPVRPGDVAVLVRTGVEATRVQRELVEQGIPAVLSRGSVLDSPAADQWRWLLEGVARPSDPRRARAAALSWFGGHDADWVAAASDEELAEFQDRLATWAETLRTQGVVAFVRRLWAESGVGARVLARRDGDRAVTDLDHVGELLQATASDGRASVAGLLAALDVPPRDENPDADLDSDLVARRIESEAEAVTIMTVWVAKGLQFPIVCVPTMWRHNYPKTMYLDEATGRRTLDVANGAGWPDKKTAAARKAVAASEAAGENLRLLYVALTRAQHHTMLWWTRSKASECSGLARVLFARDDEGVIDPARFVAPKATLPDDEAAASRLQPLVDRSGGTLDVRVHGASSRPAERWSPEGAGAPTAELTLATLGRDLDRTAHRWSFSSISHHETHEVDSFDPYDPSQGDRGAADEPSTGDDDGPSRSDEPSPHLPFGAPVAHLAHLPAGTGFGTFVHSVLEEVDFAADDLPGALSETVAAVQSAQPVDLRVDGLDASASLVAGLDAAIRTPLGEVASGRALREFGRVDRLDELDFQLRLGQAGSAPTDRHIGELVLRHLPADDPLRPWATDLAAGCFGVELGGHLTGSIDAVLRVTSPDRPDRFVVVDYKTNRLHTAGTEPTEADYGPARLADAMAEHHYPLQVLLYSVALHRYLRWRLAGYDPALHLGGAAYLFVRGMTGPEAPVIEGRRSGVFSWAVPPKLVTELSDLLDGRPSDVDPREVAVVSEVGA